jgi:hypothetical protein
MAEQNPATLTVWTIFEHPDDFPHEFVARRFRIIAGHVQPDLDIWFKAASLDAVRRSIPPALHRIGKQPGDTPATRESWL